MPGRSLTGARNPCLNRPSDRSNGRQVIRSPAVPPENFAFSAALYSVGAVGPKTTLMFGYRLVNAGMIVSCHTGKTSLRQLSMVTDTGPWAESCWTGTMNPASTKHSVARRNEEHTLAILDPPLNRRGGIASPYSPGCSRYLHPGEPIGEEGYRYGD